MRNSLEQQSYPNTSLKNLSANCLQEGDNFDQDMEHLQTIVDSVEQEVKYDRESAHIKRNSQTFQRVREKQAFPMPTTFASAIMTEHSQASTIQPRSSRNGI